MKLLDLSGGGRLDVVDLTGSVPGFFERTEDANFEPLQRFAALPQLDWADPNVKFIDVTGDGLADILITEDDALHLVRVARPGRRLRPGARFAHAAGRGERPARSSSPMAPRPSYSPT